MTGLRRSVPPKSKEGFFSGNKEVSVGCETVQAAETGGGGGGGLVGTQTSHGSFED